MAIGTSAAIKIKGLVKDYGDFRALIGVDLTVERGEVFGFIGPNGAGKSTTIRILLNLLEPTSGMVRVLGESVASNPDLRARIGYLPGELNLAATLSGRDHLSYLAGLRNGRGLDRIEELAERFGLDLDKKFKGLSKGNKQKIGVIQAFMHNPELLILDEPTSGLDPLLQQEFLDLANEASDAGATVFMSSHVLSEVEALVGRVAVIRQGEIINVSEVAGLRHDAGQHVALEFLQPVDPDIFANIKGLSEIEVGNTSLRAILQGSPDELLKVAAQHTVTAWSARDRDLEELFIDLYRQPDAKNTEREGTK